MSAIRRSALAAIVLLAVTSITAFAQEPLHERIHFTISAPYQLRNSDVVFPAGRYILFQPSETDPDLFALYKDNMRHAPLALIRTVPVEYPTDRYPAKTKIVLDTDEPRADTFPIVEGWTVPGLEGWEVSHVVANHKQVSSETK